MYLGSTRGTLWSFWVTKKEDWQSRLKVHLRNLPLVSLKQIRTMTEESKLRKYYLDNIRWSTVLLVLLYHVFYMFNGVGVPGCIPNAANIPAFDRIACLIYPWFMVLFFIISGRRTFCGQYAEKLICRFYSFLSSWFSERHRSWICLSWQCIDSEFILRRFLSVIFCIITSIFPPYGIMGSHLLLRPVWLLLHMKS